MLYRSETLGFTTPGYFFLTRTTSCNTKRREIETSDLPRSSCAAPPATKCSFFRIVTFFFFSYLFFCVRYPGIFVCAFHQRCCNNFVGVFPFFLVIPRASKGNAGLFYCMHALFCFSWCVFVCMCVYARARLRVHRRGGMRPSDCCTAQA